MISSSFLRPPILIRFFHFFCLIQKFHPAAQVAIKKRQEEAEKLKEIKVVETIKQMMHVDKEAAKAAAAGAEEAKKSAQDEAEPRKSIDNILTKYNAVTKKGGKGSVVKIAEPAAPHKTFQTEVNMLKPKLDDKLSKIINKTDDKVSPTRATYVIAWLNCRSHDLSLIDSYYLAQIYRARTRLNEELSFLVSYYFA